MGLAGWQWLFIVEGLPAVVLGVLALRVLTDRPEHADWLPATIASGSRRRWPRNRRGGRPLGHATIGASITSARVWILSGVLFMHTLVQYGIFLWLPKMLQDVSGTRGLALSAITAIPFAAALAAMVLVGRHSDRTGERKLHVAACAAVSAIGLLLAVASQGHLWLLVLSFTHLADGPAVDGRRVLGAAADVPWRHAAAAGLGLINATGNLGGFFGPTVMGWLREATGGYAGGLLVLAGGVDRRGGAGACAQGACGRRCGSGFRVQGSRLGSRFKVRFRFRVQRTERIVERYRLDAAGAAGHSATGSGGRRWG